MGTRCAVAVALTMLLIPGAASAAASLEVAEQLGTVLGSESACGLSFKQASIQAFIETKVDEGDMAFPNYLRNYTWGVDRDLQDMSVSSRLAHCTQVRRIAKTYDFID